jgi:hypothetical protein
MKAEIKTKQGVRTPLTTDDVRNIHNLCEELIDIIVERKKTWVSTFAQQTAEDIMDVLIDIKVDIDDWGAAHAEEMHDDGFLSPVGQK